MTISFDYNETRALAKQFRELTGREIKHTQIIQAMATVKGMMGDALMHMLKNAGEIQDDVAKPASSTERVFFEEKGLLGVLRREIDLSHNPLVVMHHMVGIFTLRPAQSSSIFEFGVMRRSVKDALVKHGDDPRTIVGFLDSQHFVIAFPHISNIDAAPGLFDSLLSFIPRSVRQDDRELSFDLVGAVTDVPCSSRLQDALVVCKSEIADVLKRKTSSNMGHMWDLVPDFS